jgi:hypothetical protein
MQALDSLRQHWQVVVGVVVVLLAAALVVRGVGRRRGEETPEQRRERRGKLAEDLLTIAVASVAAALSAHALTGFAQSTLGLHGAWRLLPFGALDSAAVVCALRARRRANAGQSAGVNGPLVWVLAGVSAVFSAGSSAAGRQLTVWGAVGHGIWALVAAALWEIGLVEQRRSRQARPDRRVGWIRWLHPVERLQVLAELAANTEISADEATMRVRQQRAARTLYKLNTALAALKRAHEQPSNTRGAGRALQAAERRARAAERRAQRAATRVRLADPAIEQAVMPQLRVLLDVRQIATRGVTPSAIASATPSAMAVGHGAPEVRWPVARPRHAPVSAATDTAAGARPIREPGTAAAPAETAVPSPAAVPNTAPAPVMAQPSSLAGAAPARRDQPSPLLPLENGPAGPHTHGSTALEPRERIAPTQQIRAEEAADETMDERVLRIMGWLEEDPELSGAEAARRLGIPARTGQRLRRAAQDELLRRRTNVGQRRLRSVGELTRDSTPIG